jgi:hypothetical protein
MLRFLRKYNKIILVIGGTLLMVAFLAPQAVQQVGQLQNRTIAMMDGQPVKELAFAEAEAQLRAVNALGGLGALASGLLGLADSSGGDAALHWYLLSKEASEAGLVGSDGDGLSYYPSLAQRAAAVQVRTSQQYQELARQFGPQLADQIAAQSIPELANRILENFRVTETTAARAGGLTSTEELHRAVATLRGIQRLLGQYASVPRFSEPRIRAEAAKIERAVDADLVRIGTGRFLPGVPEPTEDEIAAHFETYRDTDPAGNEFGIGYRLPQRLRLEWIELNRADIEPTIEVSALDQNKHWQENRATYPGEFSAERERVRLDLVRARAERMIEDADRVIRGEVLRATRELERDGNFYVLPERWAEERPPLEAIAQTVAERLAASGSAPPAPRVVRLDTAWQTEADLRGHPSLAGGQVRAGSQFLPAWFALFRVRELNPNPLLAIQTGLLLAENPIVMPDGSRRIVRILDVRDVSPPDSLDEIRGTVVDDIRRLRAYERLTAELDGYALVAGQGGLEAMVEALEAGRDQDDPDRLVIAEDQRILTVGGGQIVQDQEAVDRIFALADTLDPTVDPATIPEAQRTFAVKVPGRLEAFVGRIDRYRPLTTEVFRAAQGQLATIIATREVSGLGAIDNPFTLDRMKERHGWTPVGRNAVSAASSPAPPQQQQ